MNKPELHFVEHHIAKAYEDKESFTKMRVESGWIYYFPDSYSSQRIFVPDGPEVILVEMETNACSFCGSVNHPTEGCPDNTFEIS
jgi:hypothetical protein